MNATIALMPNPFNLSSDGGHGGQPFALADAAREVPAPRNISGKQEGRTGSKVGTSQTPGSPVSSGQTVPIIAEQAPGPSEAFLPGLQIGDAGQQLDEVRFLHEIMPARRGVNLDDGLAAHVPLFLTMKAPD